MLDYKRSYKRGLYGLIGDRFSESLHAITVIGDLLSDVDEFHEVVKYKDGYPALQKISTVTRDGGAWAVAHMVEQLGATTHLVADFLSVSVKRRIIANDQVLCRLDSDQLGCVPDTFDHALPPAKICLVADYGKGVVDFSLWRRIERAFPPESDCEVIAEWREGKIPPIRATAIKASWDYPPERVPPGVPVIRTLGSEGLELRLGMHRRHFPAVSYGMPVLDPCGAGDAVLASLGFARLQGMDWPEACSLAVENAAKVCSVWGAILPSSVGV